MNIQKTNLTSFQGKLCLIQYLKGESSLLYDFPMAMKTTTKDFDDDFFGICDTLKRNGKFDLSEDVFEILNKKIKQVINPVWKEKSKSIHLENDIVVIEDKNVATEGGFVVTLKR